MAANDNTNLERIHVRIAKPAQCGNRLCGATRDPRPGCGCVHQGIVKKGTPRVEMRSNVPFEPGVDVGATNATSFHLACAPIMPIGDFLHSEEFGVEAGMVQHAQRVQIFKHFYGLQECIPEECQQDVINFYSECVQAVMFGRDAPLHERNEYSGFDVVRRLDERP